MELLALGSIFFVCYVNFYVFVEEGSTTSKVQDFDGDGEQVQKIGFSQVPNGNTAPNNGLQKIGFSFGNSENRIANIVSENRVASEGNRICKHCGKSYTYKHHKQVYCSNECRNESWEQRTGKKLNFKKGGQK